MTTHTHASSAISIRPPIYTLTGSTLSIRVTYCYVTSAKKVMFSSASVRLLFVSKFRVYAKTTQQIFTKFGGKARWKADTPAADERKRCWW